MKTQTLILIQNIIKKNKKLNLIIINNYNNLKKKTKNKIKKIY